MKMHKPGMSWSRLLIAGLLIVAVLGIAWIFIVGPNPDAYFRPDPCFDGEGVMVSCEG
jgi:hypothetical protein